MLTEWGQLILALGTALATALWTLKQWREQRDKELREQEKARQQERRRLATLYVNPFLLACEELQSRLYNILTQGGLGPLNRRYPDGSYAEETLYLVVQYFGWQRCIYRYYHDQEIVRLLEKIRGAFATADYGVGAFCFYRPEQRSLGEMIILRAEGEYGFEFDTKGYNEFSRMLASSELQASESVQQTLMALRSAKKLQDLPAGVCSRLATVQSLLVDLLNYIEKKEDISFFFAEKQQTRSHADDSVCH